MIIKALLNQTLQEGSGKYSAKRATKLFVVITMLLLTIYMTFTKDDFFSWDILAMWLGYAGYNAYEMRKDKSLSLPEIK